MSSFQAVRTVTASAGEVEKLDLAIAREAGDQRGNPLVRLGGMLSEVADQPQMTVLCCVTLAAGVFRRDARLTRTGLRMLAAHGLATFTKSCIKHSIKRTRPEVLLDGGRYEMKAGKAQESREGSFPSGHTSSAVAVAGVVALDYPVLSAPALSAALAIAAIQIPRGKHYASDLAAGALIGLAACAVTEIGFGMVPGLRDGRE